MSDNLVQTRIAIVDYLRRELVGPRGDEQEILEEEPHRRYSAGTMYPQEAVTDPITGEEEEEATGTAGGTATEGLTENQADDPVVLANQYLPSSMGLSFYLQDAPGITVQVRGARYEAVPQDALATAVGVPGRRRQMWQRVPVTATEELAPGARARTTTKMILNGAARLHAVWRPARSGWLVTVTLINTQQSTSSWSPAVQECLYQMELRCQPAGEGRIVPYPRGRLLTEDKEEHILDLLYRRQASYGIGHGCSVAWKDPIEGTTAEIWTEFLPGYEVAPITADMVGFERVRNVYFLAEGDGEFSSELSGELDRFVDGYQAWIDALPGKHEDIPEDLEEARQTLLTRLDRAVGRMREGVRLLERDATVRKAFCLANRAMLLQREHARLAYGGSRHRAGEQEYVAPRVSLATAWTWRPFQLAFQLLTISSVAFEDDPARAVVDLIWFPTGGGKTEAYLAVTAFLIFYRRMMHGHAGTGTTVLMRYTLRLLTTQQFRRAATLICACEILRREDEQNLGQDEIAIGLWVGGGTTPNTFQEAYEKYLEILQDDAPKNPFQLDWCPWCGTEIVPVRRREDRALYGIVATQATFELYCPNESCPFHNHLPVAVVDDQLYNRAPTLLLGTVDKFARLPWEERVSAFFGGQTRRPPELIIQDELHLISGPLGTIVGVYETAIDALTSWNGTPPKILASTATIRRADDQVCGLYARSVELFPPSGLDASDSYFARYDRERPGRLYVGVLAPGHTASTTMIRTAAALLQAPIDLELKEEALDAYWTLVAYHNSLRELGKSRTFGLDDIPARLKVIAGDLSRVRDLDDDNVQELTSNVDAPRLGTMLERLETPAWKDDEVSLLLCTNMLSVGVDVQRLGLMLVNGQPKSTSEYIQATSRVGRGEVPGLIVCVYSPSKPRDRSHYERFVAYHSALYRHVEPTSVTPFAQPARNRALHAVLVALVRLRTALSARNDAVRFRTTLPELDRIEELILRRVREVDEQEAQATAEQIRRLVAEWEDRATARSQLHYNSTAAALAVLLRNVGDRRTEGWETLQSMRNVDRSCVVKVMGA